MKTINIGKENATFQEILALKENRTKRSQKKLFFIEGTQNIKDAIANNWDIYAFIFSNSRNLSDWAKSVLSQCEVSYSLSNNLFNKLSDKENPSELLALVKMKNQQYANLTGNPLFILIDRPSKKGNFGTILRSADALNVDQVFFTGHSVDIYDSTVITASMGSFFRIPFKFLESNKEYDKLIARLLEKFPNFQTIATSLQTETTLDSCDFTKPTMLLMGNEAKGLSKYFSDTATTLVKINMKDDVNSLNVACAASICLYEINRQRRK